MLVCRNLKEHGLQRSVLLLFEPYSGRRLPVRERDCELGVESRMARTFATEFKHMTQFEWSDSATDQTKMILEELGAACAGRYATARAI